MKVFQSQDTGIGMKITKRKLIELLYMYYTTQDNQEKRIKSLAELF